MSPKRSTGELSGVCRSAVSGRSRCVLKSTWTESAVHDNKRVHVCCTSLSCQVLLSSYALSRPDMRRVIHDRESCRPMSSTSLVSRSTVSQHACPCSCLVLSHVRCPCLWGTVQSQPPGSFCRKISLLNFVREIFQLVALRGSATWTGPACVGYSTECGRWVFVLSISNPAAP